MDYKAKLFAYTSKPQPVQIGDDTYYIRVMTGKERDAFESENYVIKGSSVSTNLKNVRARLLVRCICDENGKRVFTDSDAEQLGDIPSDILDTLFAATQSKNKLENKDIEELAKN